MKNKLLLLVVLLMTLVVFVGCSAAPAEEPAVEEPAVETPVVEEPAETVFINIGTGGTAGTYFPLGGAFAEIWNNNIDGINATAQSTGASTANINLLKDGKIEVAIVQNDIAMYSANGMLMFEGDSFPKLNGLATMYSEPLQIVTTDPNIKSIADLAGKNIAVGAIGSGVEANARQIIAAAGLDFDTDINAKFLSFSEASSGIKDGQVDVAFLTAGIPTAAIQDLSSSKDIYVVPLEGEFATQLMADYEFYTPFVIPAGTYKGQDADVQTLTVKAMLVVSADLDEEVAYQLTKQIYENHDRVVAAHNVGKFITVETAVEGMPVDVHPGALRYFKEVGVIN
ncbi:MAG: TAXI family TRAP transporter solute-binding subunit [Clostridiales bacterium]|nr:TAXI family TRAP transporter solute-binding subunit [Clostridiales bacterium]